jgi:fructuronate reductase
VERYAYDRDAQGTGIVHFGIGAFHRAHQAWYTDRAMDAGDRNWAITGVSLRSAGVAEQMNPQDGLYTVTERSAVGSRTRLVGSVREVLVASGEAARVIAVLAAPQARIVSFTVTEKGYCRAADGALDLDLAARGSFYPLLTEAMRQRREAGAGGLTLLSCDNLADNGRQLARLRGEYLDFEAPDVLAWFETECACPATMIDRIVPATTEADRDTIAEATGLRDEAAVVTEPFSQLVIEDRFAGPRPRWEAVGAQLVADVVPYETAKLRMLNGAHSALAYLGLQRGYAYVHEAIVDPTLRPLVERLMREEAATSFTPAPGQDLSRYADELLVRFANPALHHKLIQIAMDGSQKIPQRWLETLAAHQREGRQSPSILAAIAAWVHHLPGDNPPHWG